eukprot:10474602-Karenia_brevis.AAC.1
MKKALGCLGSWQEKKRTGLATGVGQCHRPGLPQQHLHRREVHRSRGVEATISHLPVLECSACVAEGTQRRDTHNYWQQIVADSSPMSACAE